MSPKGKPGASSSNAATGQTSHINDEFTDGQLNPRIRTFRGIAARRCGPSYIWTRWLQFSLKFIDWLWLGQHHLRPDLIPSYILTCSDLIFKSDSTGYRIKSPEDQERSRGDLNKTIRIHIQNQDSFLFIWSCWTILLSRGVMFETGLALQPAQRELNNLSLKTGGRC